MATKWNFETEYIQSCNCDYGCPCNFNGYPDKGHCEAFVGYKIRTGKFGDTKLDGVKRVTMSRPDSIPGGRPAWFM